MTEQSRPNPGQVKLFLDEHGIDYSKWGTNGTKNVATLADEVASGEVTLGVGEHGEPERRFTTVAVNVFHTDRRGQRWVLREDRQVFRDGEARKRRLSVSLTEKVKPGETIEAAAPRAMREELGITDVTFLPLETKTVKQDSGSFPGLRSHYTTHISTTELDRSQYDPEGYQEVQTDADGNLIKTTFFIWEKTGPEVKKIDVADTVRCVIEDSQGRVLVLQKSQDSKASLQWEFPGGKKGKKESESDAVIREVWQETGLDISGNPTLTKVDQEGEEYMYTVGVGDTHLDRKVALYRVILPASVEDDAIVTNQTRRRGGGSEDNHSGAFQWVTPGKLREYKANDEANSETGERLLRNSHGFERAL